MGAMLATAVRIFVVALPFSAQESNLRETLETIALWTDDGLGLVVNRNNGSAARLTINERVVPIASVPLVRFEEVLAEPNAPDLTGDGDFANGRGEWDLAGAVIEPGVSAGGRAWLRVDGGADRWPRRVVALSQSRPEPLILSGWCRAKMGSTAAGWMNARLAMNVYGVYVGGGRMPEQSAYFGQYDHGPQLNAKVLCPDRPLKRVEITLTAPGADCTAWYRGVTLRAARYRIVSPTSECERIDARVCQDFIIPQADLRGLLTYQPCEACIEIRCRFEGLRKDDRAISAVLAVPFDAVGGVWHDHFRASRTIEAGRLYRNHKWYGAGRDGYDGRYPIACVQGADGAGLCLGTSVDEPRVFQTEYDAARRELRIRFDLGLSPEAGRWANRGSFTAYLFRFDPRDGYRGATERYHRLFDWAFVNKRVRREGLWIAFLTPKSIPGGHKDLHFQFIEAVSNIGWDEREGMASLKYVEPWIHHHESPAHAKFAETTGAIDPAAAIVRAKKMLTRTGPEIPPELRHRFAGYLGGYIEDNWGNPQGYFFRNPNGRNENMMIVNPSARIPPPPGAHFASGDWDREVIHEATRTWKQWCLDGWNLYRTTERPGLEIDARHKASGKQSVRLDPARSKNYWEHYVRGMSQTLYYAGQGAGPFEFSFWARGENMPTKGTGLRWTIEFQSKDDTVSSHHVDLKAIDGQWRRFTHKVNAPCRPFAIKVLLVNSPWFPDPTTLWVDDVRLTIAGKAENLLANGDFESAELLPGRVDGVYLDTMECYTNNLNYRRSHWPYADEPLTFDSARRPTLQQQFSHVSYAKRMAARVRMRDMLLFGNCAPGTCFAAPYLDVMGGEENWMPEGRWAPKSDADFNFVRFMGRAKPFCLLQYADLDTEHQARYIKRCVFYGVWPGHQSSSPTTGKWYWDNPVRIARDRPTYAEYMPILAAITQAGWQPVTLAASSNPNVWLERFGQGRTIYLTAFNATAETQSSSVTIDLRAGMTRHATLVERVHGRRVAWNDATDPLSFNVKIGPEDVRVFKASR